MFFGWRKKLWGLILLALSLGMLLAYIVPTKVLVIAECIVILGAGACLLFRKC